MGRVPYKIKQGTLENIVISTLYCRSLPDSSKSADQIPDLDPQPYPNILNGCSSG